MRFDFRSKLLKVIWFDVETFIWDLSWDSNFYMRSDEFVTFNEIWFEVETFNEIWFEVETFKWDLIWGENF